jgi:hypothetical protein
VILKKNMYGKIDIIIPLHASALWIRRIIIFPEEQWGRDRNKLPNKMHVKKNMEVTSSAENIFHEGLF